MTTSSPPLSIDTASLLSDAVHKSSPWSPAGIAERLFTRAFSGLVYAQIWEDPVVDLEALELGPDSRIVAIASGGCNALSYLTASPAEVTAIDLNATHVSLNRLKKAAAQTLDYEQFKGLIEGSAVEVSDILEQFIAPRLDSDTLRYWRSRDRLGRRRIEVFRRNIFRTGLLGRFIGAAHMLSRLHGVDPSDIISSNSLAEQRHFFDQHLAPLFDRRIMQLLLSNPASLFGLGIPPAQFRELGSSGESMSAVVRERLRRLCCDFPLSDNYFAWQAFNRAYGFAPDTPRPPYLQRESFPALKANADRLSIVHGSITEHLEKSPRCHFDRFILLDAQDWMSPAELTRLWLAIDNSSPRGARVIFRTAGTESILPGRIPDHLLAKWSYHDQRSAELHARDRSAIYGGFHLYSKTS